MKMSTVGPVGSSRDYTEALQTDVSSETFWIWEFDFRTNQLSYSDELVAFLGAAPGQNMSAEESLQYVHSEDRDRVRAALMKPAEGVRQTQVAYRVVTASGAVRLVRARAQFVMDDHNQPTRVVGLVQDITERKRAEDALRESEERYRSIVAALSEGVIFQDAGGQIIDLNARAEEILGYESDVIKGATSGDPIWQAVREDRTPFPGDEHPAVVTLTTGKPCKDVVMGIHHPEKGLRWLEINSEPLFEGEATEPYAVVVSFADISERQVAEESLGKSQNRLQEANRIGRVGHWELDTVNWRVRMYGELYLELGAESEETEAAHDESFASLHEDDIERVQLAYERSIGDGTRFDETYRILRPDNSICHVRAIGEPFRDEDGKIIGMRGTIHDVSEQLLAENKLRESQRLYSVAARYGRTAPWEILVQERIVLADENLSFVSGVEGRRPPRTLDEWAEHLLPEDVELLAAAIKRVADGQDAQFSLEYRCQGPDEAVRWMHASGRVAEHVDGKPSRILGTTRDITEQKEAEEAMRASEQRVSTVLQNVAESVVTIDERGVILSANQAFAKTFGYSVDEVVGKDVSIIMPEPYRSGHVGYMGQYFESGVSQILGKAPRELEAVDKDGRVFPIELMIGEGMIGGQRVFIGSMRDVSDRKLFEEQLNRSSERLREAHRIANLGHWEFDAASQMFQTHGELFSDFEFGSDQSSTSFNDMNQTIHPEDFDCAVTAFELALADGTRFDEIYRVVEADGKIVHIHAIGEVNRDDTGKIVGMRGTTQDITELAAANEALRESEERYALAAEYGKTAVWEIHPEDGSIYADKKLPDLIGVGDHEPAEKAIDWLERVPDEEKDRVRRAMEPVFEGREKRFTIEHRGSLADGTLGWFRDEGFLASAPGEKIRVIGTTSNITERKETEQQLQQAQKMETVGQLTGGIAHDFNNLLAVISGNLELAKERLPVDSDLRQMLDTAFRASQRGADLTGRLLAYSRRQTLIPQPTDINELTGHMLGLAKRTLGEAVEVVFEPVEEAWWAHVDPAQLESALLNLAINARDAMPDGGTLTIRTENVGIKGETLRASEALSAGDYVLIEVTDTGTGMSEDVREKVFEPFFTTKEVGEGSGLGLSMVYGFAKQSGGHVDIESTVGKGTAIRLYLPRSEPVSKDTPQVQAATIEVRSSGETVLIVEDDPHVRELAVSLVKSLGYIVLEAGEASSALEVMENGTQVDLLLSDVILGKGMNGVELANQIRESCPDTKVLLMSGYAREAFTQEDGLGDTYELISKPFKMADLAQHIEALLRQRPGTPIARPKST